MKRVLLVAIGAIASLSVWAQTGTVSGRVIDAESLEPLPFANAFINNSTLGAATSLEGEFLIKNVPVGSVEVVFSFVGYQSYQARVNVQDGQDTRMNIKLTALPNQLAEVQVKGTRDKAWERDLRKFEKIFLGTDDFGRQCKILNPAAVDFPETKDGSFVAVASEPIKIRNEALGYLVTYYLKSFRSDDDNYAIVGNARFEELSTENAEEARRWTEARKQAYLGSPQHLFRSLIAERSEQEGFRLYISNGPAVLTNRGKIFGNELNRTIEPLKLRNIVSAGNTLFERRINLGTHVEVHYVNEPTLRPTYADISHCVSWLDMKNGPFRVSVEGLPINPTEVIYSGDMGLARVSNLLPLDYQTQSVVSIKSANQVDVLRKFEKVYLHTSKSFYYPGEIIWFKAYMNYANRQVRDSLSQVLYVDLLDEQRKVVQTRTLRIENTIAAGSFPLPENTKPGTYALVAYTNWMRNFGSKAYFTKPIPVLDIYQKMLSSGTSTIANSRDLEVTFDKEQYGPRELATVSLQLVDDQGKPIGGNFSVSITDPQQVPPPSWIREDIVSGFAIPSQIDVAGGKVIHPVEHGISWRGQFTPEAKKRTKTELTIIRGAFEGVKKVTPDENGMFEWRDLDFFDSATFSIQAFQKNQAFGKISVKPRDIPFSDFAAKNYTIPTETRETVQRIISEYEVPRGAFLLEEVTVRATKVVDTIGKERNLLGKGDIILNGQDIQRMGSMETLLRTKAPGFRLNFNGMHWQLIHIRGESTLPPAAMATNVDRTPEPTLTIDNIVQTIGSGETVGDRLMYMDVSRIDRVEISSVGSSYTGANGSFGVVAVFLKKNAPPELTQYQRVKVKGFDFPAQFRGPDYALTSEDHSKADYRSTLYWNQNVNVRSDGFGYFSFYTSDKPGPYRYVIEGVSFEGKPLHWEIVR